MIWIELMYTYILVHNWEVLSIPPMSGMTLTEGTLRLDFTAIYVVVTVGGCSNPKPVIRNGEESINCTVAKHSIG